MNAQLSEALEAIQVGDYEYLEHLIEEGLGVNSIYKGNAHLLQYALTFESLKCFEVLLRHGADPEKEVDGWSPLNMAIDSEITSSTDDTWEYGIRDKNKMMPNPVFTSCLINHGADPYRCDPNGLIPQKWAAERGHMTFKELLDDSIAKNT